jgi:hypothetical protein
MSFLKKLFGGGSGGAPARAAPTQDHDGYLIAAAPYREEGQWQLCGVISKEIDGVRREHRYVRADRFGDRDEAVEMTFTKGRQIIDQRRGDWPW